MAMTAAERKRNERARKRTSSLHQLANRKQMSDAAEGYVAECARVVGGIRQGAQAAAAIALQGISEAQKLASRGGEENIREAARRADAALVLLQAAQAQLPAPAAEPPPLTICLPRQPDEPDDEYEALLAWYREGKTTDPPPGNRDWASRAALAEAYSDMAEGQASVRQGVRIGLPAHNLQGHALLAKLGRDAVSTVARVTEVPGAE